MSSSDSETSSTAPTPPTSVSAVEPTSLKLDVKFVDSRWKDDAWTYQDTANPEVPAELVEPVGISTAKGSEDWKDYCFVVVRKYSSDSDDEEHPTITFKIMVKSMHLLTALKTVVGSTRGVSWDSEPVVLSPKLLITYFPRLQEFERELSSRPLTESEEHILASLRVLLDYMRKNYEQTLARIESLTAHGEITFDLLYAILIPGSVMTRRCPVTGETRALCLRYAAEGFCGQWNLVCEGLELATSEGREDEDGRWSGEMRSKPQRWFGMESICASIGPFEGVQKISALCVSPLEYHPDPQHLATELIQRARRWVALSGMHHVQYRGIASRQEGRALTKYSVQSRVMLDKKSFALMDPNYCLPQPDCILELETGNGAYGLEDAHLLLASPILYGFSFSDKKWLEFNVNHVTPIVWNYDAFSRLVLPPARKMLLQSLVGAHKKLRGSGDGGFDDIVRGKGQGLVISLSGPPGVGKTLSGEATAEGLRRPLYIVGSGDLGTTAAELDDALEDAFALAATWNAVLLIDEADVFLEKRSLHDLTRNAMVAVFLRHIEYYRGILFLTTNRVKAFDEAFFSRIHVALHFGELTVSAKAEIWRSFLSKVGAEVSDAMVAELAERPINGRQIKNACRTATSLAVFRDEKIRYEHIVEALSAMDEFAVDFAAVPSNQ